MTLNDALQGMIRHFNPEAARGVNAVIQMNISGEDGGTHHIKIANGQAELIDGPASDPTITLSVSAQDWLDITSGKLDGVKAFMTGKLKVQGDMGLMMKFQQLFQR